MAATTSITGALVKYFRVQPVVVAGALLSFTGLVIGSFGREFYVLFITIPFMTGIGCSLCFASTMTIISDYFHQHFALAWGIAWSGGSVGIVTFPIVSGFLIDNYGWRGALLVISAIQANILVCAKFMKPTPNGQTSTNLVHSVGKGYSRLENQSSHETASAKDEKDVDGDSKASAFTNQSRSGSGVGAECKDDKLVKDKKWLEKLVQFLDHAGVSLIWTNRVFASCLLLQIPTSVGNSVTLPFLVARAESVGVLGLQAELLLSVVGVANIVGNLINGPLVDANVAELALIYGVVEAVVSVSAISIAILESYPFFVVYAVLFGFSSGIYIPLGAIMVRRIVGQERFAGGFGIALMLVASGNMLAASISGHLYDTTKSYSGCFYFLGAAAGLCIVLLLGLHLLWTRLVPDDRWPTIKRSALRR
ncbi:monocarboxylate transporter 12-like [Acanthaster planci]|uniref:Monocarboxylate transporter 12-like n=1 Tax=Acanthaster planci TaxID=133434 RepID=A0A8B7XYY3_ACAPL|nr:monocarboxylate transporter 12-like [Acanthaster planci]